MHHRLILGSFCIVCAAIAFLLGARPSMAADMTARQVTQLLFQADEALPVDFSGLNLQNLDLARLNFKRAKLTNTDLFGSDLTGADLSGTDLKSARLDRVTLINSKFDGANLSGATILRPTSFSTLVEKTCRASSFVGVEMTGAKCLASLTVLISKDLIYAASAFHRSMKPVLSNTSGAQSWKARTWRPSTLKMQI